MHEYPTNNTNNIYEISAQISDDSRTLHRSVLLKEVLEYLEPKPNENFIDGTLGAGGHTLAILEKTSPKGKILAIDLSAEAIEAFKLKIEKENLKERVILVQDNFSHLAEIVGENDFKNVSGIVLDLGFSSDLLEKSGRGFSFLRNEPLDMRYGNTELTAEQIVNNWPEIELEKIIRENSEERFAKKIARQITEERKKEKIKTTFQLVEVIKKAVPFWYQQRRIHPATKTFQALRIAVNDELENLKKVLPQAIRILDEGRRVAIISFHSLEDRIVKNFFRQKEKEKILKIFTKKPVQPTEAEKKLNPRSRSAKLRVAERQLTTNNKQLTTNVCLPTPKILSKPNLCLSH